MLFCIYSTLIAKSGTSTRFAQLVQWCGGMHFQGVFVFDECHRAKNLVPGKESGSGTTQTARATKNVQAALPNARVVYVSATGASELSHMAYMDRLGLWGQGTAFASTKAFVDALANRGTGAMEMIAMDMKGRGMFLSRTLSYRGASFRVHEEAFTPSFKALYDQCCELWGDLARAMVLMKETVNVECQLNPAETRSLNRMNSTFWSAHLRFFTQMTMSAKIPAVVRLAAEALANNQCVVIGLQTTGQAECSAAVAAGAWHAPFS